MSNPGEEGMGPLERGRKRYQQKNYKGALEAFTEAVNTSSENVQLTALDYRAATYEKLGHLKPALRDSKQMIDFKPELSKGYLRCGKILQLKGENSLALKIYERGLSKVKFGTDNERTALLSMFNKLRNAQDPTRSLDPLHFLPIELAELVVQNLNMRDRVICLRVSKAWKKLLESSHKLWTTLDTTSAQKPLSQHSLKFYLRRSNYTLDTAVIHSKAHFDAKKWVYLTKTCKKLHSLKINGAGVIGSSLIEALPLALSLTSITVSTNCEISISAVCSVLRTCQKTLVDAVFHSIKGSSTQVPWPRLEPLQSLDIRTRDNMMAPPGLQDLLPNIRILTLVGWVQARIDLSLCEKLENVSLVDMGLNVMPKFPPTIKHLNLSRNPRLLGDPDQEEPFNFPLLEVLNCTSTDFTGENIKGITTCSIKEGNLKGLLLGSRLPLVAEVPVADEYPASNTVQELSLAGLHLQDRRAIDIVNLYPNIMRLDVSSTKITGVAVKHFVGMGIKWLKLDECAEISPDAVEYARGKDVEVEYNFPSRRSAMGFRDRIASAY